MKNQGNKPGLLFRYVSPETLEVSFQEVPEAIAETVNIALGLLARTINLGGKGIENRE